MPGLGSYSSEAAQRCQWQKIFAIENELLLNTTTLLPRLKGTGNALAAVKPW